MSDNVRVAVLFGFGINCDRETAAVFELSRHIVCREGVCVLRVCVRIQSVCHQRIQAQHLEGCDCCLTVSSATESQHGLFTVITKKMHCRRPLKKKMEQS